MVELILSRHGETLENQRHLLQGQLPGTLSPLGLQQAEDLAERLKNETIEAVVCSDLDRSYRTAQAVAQRHGLEPQPTPLLREMDWGSYTGKRLDDIDWYHLPEGAESMETLLQRAKDFLDYIRREFEGKRVVAIGHGAFNRAILTAYRGQTAEKMLELPIMGNTECIRLTL